jgi:glucose-6-phosphate-specific signal transduction histidine kinase
VYKAQGRPEVLTRISFFRILVLLPCLYWAASQAKSIEMVGWAHAVVAFLFGLITLAIASQLLHASLWELVVALRPAVLAGTVMGLVVLMLMSAVQNTNELIQLVIGIVVGGITYAAALWIFERSVVVETFQILRGALEK